jgi:hypothetical protein
VVFVGCPSAAPGRHALRALIEEQLDLTAQKTMNLVLRCRNDRARWRAWRHCRAISLMKSSAAARVASMGAGGAAALALKEAGVSLRGTGRNRSSKEAAAASRRVSAPLMPKSLRTVTSTEVCCNGFEYTSPLGT